ncbi:hypothetical protein PT305_01255 [Metamycoplasma hyosynoviae]|uniref:hypothetical protein n=1 Tax=Metamycoplasma hyosynoviae TaxID=29559 RepID=UPI002362183B|nr:hypothetical protein [Metamycoplasma hyosynoviae]MDD1359977.1 hypothetical protein [Metamycoplasma hyosynoviae]
MFKINKFPQENYVDFEGIAIIETTNKDSLFRNLYEYEKTAKNAAFEISDFSFYLNDCIQISQLTKTSDLFNFNVKNVLVNKILENEYWNQESIIKHETLNAIQESLNSFLGLNYVSIDIDFSKMYKLLFSLDDDFFITKEVFYKWLDSMNPKTKMTIIISNWPDIQVQELLKYTNTFNFIIITNEIFNTCKSFEELELSFIFKNDQTLHHIYSKTPIETWIENQYQINENEFFELKNNREQWNKCIFDIKNKLF